MKKLLLAATLVLLTIPTQADNIYRSLTLVFNGTCDGTDQVYSWKIAGAYNAGGWQITPWRSNPINIVGVELNKISGGPTTWLAAGNNVVGDIMIMLGPSQNHDRHDFPAGLGMPFPSIADATPKNDLHGGCTGGGAVSVFYIVYYVDAIR